MIYLITALDAEAKAIVEHYRLKRDTSLPYTLYRGEDILLLVTGIGKINTLMSVSTLLGWRIPERKDILINIGICGAPSTFEIGEPLLIHQIIDNGRCYYPDILYTHTLRESTLTSVESPQASASTFPVDMESAGVFQAASRFFKLHQIAFLKIVSDHFEPHNVTKEGVMALLKSHIPTVEILFASLKSIASVPPLFSEQEHHRITLWKRHFTIAQGVKLDDALHFFRLKYPTHDIPFPNEDIPHSKRERSTLHEHFISILLS